MEQQFAIFEDYFNSSKESRKYLTPEELNYMENIYKKIDTIVYVGNYTFEGTNYTIPVYCFYTETITRGYLLYPEQKQQMLKKFVDTLDIIHAWKNDAFVSGDLQQTTQRTLDDKPISMTVGEGQQIYFTTDIHGDLNSLMFSLLKSGAVKYKEGESPVVFFDLGKKQIITDLSTISDFSNIVSIPNVEVNPDFEGQFIFGGDVIDRGPQSVECACLMHYILKQEGNSEDKIKFMMGNHEDMYLRKDLLSIIRNEGLTLFHSKQNIFVELKNNIKSLGSLFSDLVNSNKAKFCYASGNTLFSHTILTKSNLLKALELIKDTEKKEILKTKIETEKTLEDEDIKNLSNILNGLFKEYTETLSPQTKSKRKESLLKLFFGEFDAKQQNVYGLLWDRLPRNEYGSIVATPEKEVVKGLYQVVGHTPVISKIPVKIVQPIINGNIIYSDTIQSIGYRQNVSGATLLTIDGSEINVESAIITPQNITTITLKTQVDKNKRFFVYLKNVKEELEPLKKRALHKIS